MRSRASCHSAGISSAPASVGAVLREELGPSSPLDPRLVLSADPNQELYDVEANAANESIPEDEDVNDDNDVDDDDAEFFFDFFDDFCFRHEEHTR